MIGSTEMEKKLTVLADLKIWFTGTFTRVSLVEYESDSSENQNTLPVEVESKLHYKFIGTVGTQSHSISFN